MLSFFKSSAAFLVAAIITFIGEAAALVLPIVTPYLLDWVEDSDTNKWEGFVYMICVIGAQLFQSLCSHLATKWIFVLSLRIRNGLIAMIYDKTLKLNSSIVHRLD